MEMALASGVLLFEDGVDVVHFTQLLKKRDEVQELSVRHVVKP